MGSSLSRETRCGRHDTPELELYFYICIETKFVPLSPPDWHSRQLGLLLWNFQKQINPCPLVPRDRKRYISCGQLNHEKMWSDEVKLYRLRYDNEDWLKLGMGSKKVLAEVWRGRGWREGCDCLRLPVPPPQSKSQPHPESSSSPICIHLHPEKRGPGNLTQFF